MKKAQEEKDTKFEIHAKLISSGEEFGLESEEKNLFIAINNALKKLTGRVM